MYQEKENAPRYLLAVFLFCSAIFSFTADKTKLDTINKQIIDIETKLQQMQKEKGSILNDIYQVELRQKKESIENQRLNIQLAETTNEIEKKKQEKQKLRREIEESRENIGRALRILYKLGSSPQLKFFTRVPDYNELFKNYHLFVSLINYKADEITGLRENILKLAKIDKELQNKYANLLNLKKAQDEKLHTIDHLKQNKLEIIEKINNDRISYTKLIDELKKEALKVDEVIREEGIKSRLAPLDIQKLQGRLEWPLPGKVISSFGKKKSTRFDTYILDNGIEIKPSDADGVKAIYDGEVVFSDYFKGYGNLIIIQHAKNFYSLYGHCETVLKKKGDKVTEGEVISTVGNSGSTSIKSLYFEIRKDLKPENPLKWLRAK